MNYESEFTSFVSFKIRAIKSLKLSNRVNYFNDFLYVGIATVLKFKSDFSS